MSLLTAIRAAGRAAGAVIGARQPRPVDYGESEAETWREPALALLAAIGLSPTVRQRKGTRAALDSLETLLLSTRSALLTLAKSFVNGNVTLREWYRRFRNRLIASHTAGTIVYYTGPEIEPADLATLGILVGVQDGHLRRFRDSLDRPFGQADRVNYGRVAMYAYAVWSVAMGVEQQAKRRDGFTEAMRILGAADHCTGCVATAGIWFPIDSCPPIGSQQCMSYCHCRIAYRGPSGTVMT